MNCYNQLDHDLAWTFAHLMPLEFLHFCEGRCKKLLPFLRKLIMANCAKRETRIWRIAFIQEESWLCWSPQVAKEYGFSLIILMGLITKTKGIILVIVLILSISVWFLCDEKSRVAWNKITIHWFVHQLSEFRLLKRSWLEFCMMWLMIHVKVC